MGNNKDNIKNLFSAGLKDYEPSVPKDLWADIEKDLPARKIVFSKRLFLKVASIAACVLVVSAATIVLIYNADIFNQNKKSSHITSKPISKPDEILLSEPEPNVVIKKQYALARKPIAKIAEEKMEVKDFEVIEETNEVVQLKRNFYKRSNSKPDKQNIPEDSRRLKRSFYSNLDEYIFISDEEKEKEKAKEMKALEMAHTPKLVVGIEAKGLFPINKTTEWLKEPLLKTIYNQPVSVGLTVSKYITPKFSLQSGITYTNLSARSFTIDEGQKENTKLRLHYIGIPLSANYDITEWKKVKISVSGGGILQKDIAGKLTQYQYNSNVENSSVIVKENISQNNPQLSVFTNVGFSYPIYDKLYFYTTFGGSYYFDANNKYRTIYDENKFQLDLDFGLKYSF